ncbi:MAG: CBS domain-containing protein [Fervidicoccaceae archaeon]
MILIVEPLNKSSTQKGIILNFLRKNVPFVTKDEKALKAREIMRESLLRILPVFESESKRKVIGVVHRIDLLNISSTKSNLTVNDIMSRDFILFDEEVEIIEALRGMLKNGEWYSIVENKNGEFEGVFGLEGGIKYLVNIKKEKLSSAIDGIYTRNPIYLFENEEISKVWYLMLKHKYAGFPVINDRKILVGVVTQHDLLKRGYSRPVFESSSSPRKIEVREIMNVPPLSVSIDSTASEVVEIMLKKDIGRVYVVENKRLIGVVDREDIVRFLLKNP